MCRWMSLDCERAQLLSGVPALLYLTPLGGHIEGQLPPSSHVANAEGYIDQNEGIPLAAGDDLDPLACRRDEPASDQSDPCRAATWHSSTASAEGQVLSQHPQPEPQPLPPQPEAPPLASSLPWTAVLLLGLGTGLTALGMNLAAENLAGLRLVALLGLTSDSPSLIGFPPLDHLHLALLLVAATLCAAIALTAGSTGLGELGREGGAAELLQHPASRAALVNTLWKACQLSCQVLLARQLALSGAAELLVAAPLPLSEPAGEDGSTTASRRLSPLTCHVSELPSQQSGDQVDSPLALRDLGSAVEGDQSADRSASTSGRAEVEATAVIGERDLAMLMWRLESPGGDHADARWEVIVEKECGSVKYTAKRRDPENNGATEYFSTSRFENCTAEALRDFYMDSENLLRWDPMVRSYRQLEVCAATGVETGHFVKKYPLCSAREYVLAWRVWEKCPGVYYCITKAVDHHQVPRQQKLRRVEAYMSMWRISAVPGTQAAEVVVYVQEDNGMPRELAKMAFRRGVWGYIRKTEEELRRYAGSHPRPSVGPTAVSLASQVPPNLIPAGRQPTAATGGMGRRRGSASSLVALLGMATARMDSSTSFSPSSSHGSSHGSSSVHLNGSSEGSGDVECGPRGRSDLKDGEGKFRRLRRLVSSVIMVGGAVVLTNGTAPLGVKVAAAFLLPSVMNPQRLVMC